MGGGRGHLLDQGVAQRARIYPIIHAATGRGGGGGGGKKGR